MGAGKTTVLAEASDILALRNITHAAIELDALGLAGLPSAASNDGVMYRNLQSVCKNYASLGVRRLLLARANNEPCNATPRSPAPPRVFLPYRPRRGKKGAELSRPGTDCCDNTSCGCRGTLTLSN